MEKKNYYLKLDLIRIISCIGVLFYHLGILKSGYLAVCTFFVLTGYLSCVSSFQKEKFSILKYYKSRFFSIYVPLLLVVFTTICMSSLLPNIHWLTLKPETNSVLLGFNNYWQLSANMDYFARHINSPFMHFWYIAILLQFEVLFPFLFIGIKKLKELSSKYLMILLLLLTLSGFGYFYYQSTIQPIMVLYYDSLTRCFSILLGIFLGCFHVCYQKMVSFKNKILQNILFYFYLILFIASFFGGEKFVIPIPLMMVLITLLSGRLIEYGTMNESQKNPIISFLSSISYEIYLVQYPVIFFMQNISMDYVLKIILMVLLILILSILLHYALMIRKKKTLPIFIISGIWVFFSVLGLILYGVEEDHTKEMNALEEQLSLNKEMMLHKQMDYASQFEEKKTAMNQSLEEINSIIQSLDSYVHMLPVVGVGDSVMLGAVPNLYATFPNGYFDAGVSRTDWEAGKILQSLKYNGILGDPIIINLGTNGQCGEKCRLEILSICENRNIFWVNVINDWEVHVNDDLASFAERNAHVHLIDWAGYANGHMEYFISDGIHLTSVGREAYASFLYQSLYDYYLKEYTSRKERIENTYYSELNQKTLLQESFNQ